MATALPALPGVDHSLQFLRQGYDFVGQGCRTVGADRFRARVMLRPVICAQGADAARLIYDPDLFTRKGAMPPHVLRLLQDKNSVQMLDGPPHRHRKGLFTSLLMTDEAEQSLLDLLDREWGRALQDWTGQDRIVLFDQVNLILTRAILGWTGVTLDDPDRMAGDLSAMIENTGRLGPRMWQALARRRRVEARIRRVIRAARADAAHEDSPLHRIARFRDADGKPLTLDQAVVELINILRPTVAIGRYVAFAALALHRHPSLAPALRQGQLGYEAFAEEVRRHSPFFPVIGGIARRGFDWNGVAVAKGDWMLVDLFGTCHDPRLFPAPQDFDPQRPLSWRDFGSDFVPQGAGSPHDGHRCPGERLTVAVIRHAARMLVERMDYSVPPQDLTVSLSHVPALPASGMVLAAVRPRATRPGP
ncbi:cytochrome P450 [Paracoccus aerius]|uniref:Cytochrome P450 n=1 Tax=Paracoccus aerius TaxID=1915382 RepID=A0ABS1S8J6_9RHOB|nr:cytochrome P450 [Paracoccus aerius]MBL3674424.1 cytochrome P450 [Paracoccus aerius]GHG26185.1 cytochrome P450 [Paracoccus aerius]